LGKSENKIFELDFKRKMDQSDLDYMSMVIEEINNRNAKNKERLKLFHDKLKSMPNFFDEGYYKADKEKISLTININDGKKKEVVTKEISWCPVEFTEIGEDVYLLLKIDYKDYCLTNESSEYLSKRIQMRKLWGCAPAREDLAGNIVQDFYDEDCDTFYVNDILISNNKFEINCQKVSFSRNSKLIILKWFR